MTQTDKKIESWTDLTECLKIAKKEGRNKGLQVAAIIRLIYAGAFDGLTDKPLIGDKPDYAMMTAEVKDALDSDAKPPKAKKGDIVGLAEAIEANDESMLHLWRWSVNPLYEFDLLGLVLPAAKEFGFSTGYLLPAPYVAWTQQFYRKKNCEVYLTDQWSSIFEDAAKLKMFQFNAILAIPLIITEAEVKMYGKNGEKKERWCFKGHTGHEFTDEIVCWPDLEFTVSESKKSQLSERKIGIALVQLSVFNGRRGGSLARWYPIVGGSK